MSLRSILALAVLAALVLSTSGCVMHANSLDLTRVTLEEQIPGARFDSEFQLTLGRMSLGLVRKILKAVDEDEDEAMAILRNIHKVEVAVYRTESLPSFRRASFTIPQVERLKKKGWQTVARVSAKDSLTWVLYREEGGNVRGLMVGALDDDELVLVKLRGDVKRLLDQVIDEGILDVPGVVEADLEPEPGKRIATVESEGVEP